MDIPTIKGEWKQDDSYTPDYYDHYIRVVDSEGNATIRSVDRYTYERVREIEMWSRYESV